MQYKHYKDKNASVLINQKVLADYQPGLFCRETLAREQHDTCSRGRGNVMFYEHDSLQLVLKTYHRGGLLGRMIKNSYLYSGTERSRMWREFLLLGQMRDLGLPVPRPVATRCVRTSPLCYQGDLITERIADAQTLAEVLSEKNLSDTTWEAIGRIIQRFHHHNIDHTDLNACNILLTRSGKIYLIDFDKCAIRRGRHKGWRRDNLNRLRRSLGKWEQREATFHFNKEHWQALQRGYSHPNTNTPSSSESRLSSLRSLP